MLLSFIGKRLLQMIPLLLCVTIIIFVVIQLPPGDYLTTYIRQKESTGTIVGAEEIAALRTAHAVALDRLQADREAERQRIGDLVAQLIADTEARERVFTQRLAAAENERDEAREAENRERRRAAELAGKVERLMGTLDGLRQDREAEVAAYETMRDQCRILAAELQRLRRPWWRRLFTR